MAAKPENTPVLPGGPADPPGDLEAACRRHLELVRKNCPDLLPRDPVPPGTPVDPVPVPPDRATDLVRAAVRVLRWQSPAVLLAVTEGAVHSLTHPGGPGAWALAQVAVRPAVPLGGPPAVVPAPAAGPGLPAFGAYNDLAVDPTAAGALYLATSHPLEPRWWWDGAACHPTGLGTLPAGTRAPAYSVVVDPATPTVVFVGTTVGVWRGTLTPPAGGNPPRCAWAQYANGLPEAVVQDLGIAVYPGRVGDHRCGCCARPCMPEACGRWTSTRRPPGRPTCGSIPTTPAGCCRPRWPIR